MASLESIIYKNGKLVILDQLLLPRDSVYFEINSVEDGWNAIKNMQVRGAPAIGIVAGLSLAVELRSVDFNDRHELVEFVTTKMDYLVTSRPTAVNIVDTKNKLLDAIKQCSNESAESLKERLLQILESMQARDISVNKAISDYGADHILASSGHQEVNILTICNTGSLATGGYGTALGVVRTLFTRERLERCYFLETRPYNQGSRLTAYELVYEHIPHTLICDNMAASLMARTRISAVIVGADRVVANGDTANKIGTYQLAVLANYFKVAFYVAAPTSSIDLSRASGQEIVIEERPARELTHVNGVAIAPEGVHCWNPAFDVTPAELITGGIITEFGVFAPHELKLKVTQALTTTCQST